MSIDAALPYAVCGFMIVMAVGFAFVAWQKRCSDRARIREVLLDKGYRDIVIRYVWFDFDRSNSTYSVESRNRLGVPIVARCKIHRWPGWDGEIYWSDPL